MRQEEHDVGRGSGNFRDDVFHLHVADGRRSMEGLGIDRTAESFELADDVILGAMAAVRPGRARTDGYEIGDVLKGSLTVERRPSYREQAQSAGARRSTGDAGSLGAPVATAPLPPQAARKSAATKGQYR